MAKDPDVGARQYELELFDQEQQLAEHVRLMREEIQYSSSQSLVILSAYKENYFYLGIRTFVYDTDYERRVLITKEQARYLCEKHGVNPFLSRDKIYSEGP